MPRLELYVSDKDRERLSKLMSWYDEQGVNVRSPRGDLSLAATIRRLAMEKENEIGIVEIVPDKKKTRKAKK